MTTKTKKKIVAGLLAFNMAITPAVVFGNERFVDVPSTHWAHEAITNMADSGFMLPNSAGEFRPDQPLDKFETARILASVAGFRHIGNTPEQQSFIDFAVENNQELIASLENTYSRWSSTSNREISFLLEMGILTPSDLQSFIVFHEGTEHLRALSRSEAAVFLVRATGLTGEANQGVYSELFADDGVIPAAARIFVYFLRAHGVVAGDEAGNFVPNSAVTRAAFAIMLDRTMTLSYTLYFEDNTETSPSAPAVADERTGTITVLYPAINAIQLQTEDSSSIHRLSPNANIMINGTRGTFETLSVGMSVEVEIVENSIISLNAVSSGIVTLPAPLPTPTPLPTNPQTPTPLPEQVPPTEETPDRPDMENVYTTLQAKVSEVEVENNRLIVTMEFLTPTGGIESQEMAFHIVDKTEINLGHKTINLADIVAGDMVTMRVSAGNAYKVDVFERYRSFMGTIEERVHNTETNVISYIIRDENNVKSSFIVTKESIIEREGAGKVDWNRIRIGDTVEVVAEQTQVVTLYAFGGAATVEGIIEQVTLRNDVSTVVVNVRGISNTYYITGKVEGMNNLRVGDRTRLRLESREVEAITILN